MPQQRRLADPGLADHHQRAALPPADRRHHLVKHIALAAPPEQAGTPLSYPSGAPTGRVHPFLLVLVGVWRSGKPKPRAPLRVKSSIYLVSLPGRQVGGSNPPSPGPRQMARARARAPTL